MEPAEKSKWESLAEMLGAKKVSPTTSSEQPPQPVSPPRIRPDAPPPPRKQADWEALAGELGLERQVSTDKPAQKAPIEDVPNEPEPAQPRAKLIAAPAQDDSSDADPDFDTVDEFPPDQFEPAPRESSAISDDHRPATRPAPDGTVPHEQRAAGDRPPGEERRPSRRRRRKPARRKEADAQDDSAPARSTADRAEQQVREELPAKKEPQVRRESGQLGKRLSHKSIPSWPEAIAIMIDANLGSRSPRRKAGPSEGRGRGRGRRGGRRG